MGIPSLLERLCLHSTASFIYFLHPPPKVMIVTVLPMPSNGPVEQPSRFVCKRYKRQHIQKQVLGRGIMSDRDVDIGLQTVLGRGIMYDRDVDIGLRTVLGRGIMYDRDVDIGLQTVLGRGIMYDRDVDIGLRTYPPVERKCNLVPEAKWLIFQNTISVSRD